MIVPLNGIVIVDATVENKPLIFVNPAFEQMIGYPAKFDLVKNCRFLKGPDTDRKKLDRIKTATKTGESCKVGLLNYKKKDGIVFWNKLSISVIMEAGKIVGFVGI